MISFQIKNRSVMGRNKYIQCSTCLKSIRSDNMKFHMHSKDVKYKMKICPTCKTNMKADNLSRHMRKHDKQSHLDLIVFYWFDGAMIGSNCSVKTAPPLLWR